ncbi:MAG: helix-turn-helix transcriptional regulator [Treponema sp.]|nr:helix-turn-helix transcriptional regulator [Treponema sp.]
METFADRLRAEIEYSGMLQKEVAYKAGVKKRALDMYLGSQGSMPPADVAVKIAKVLNVTVEYLVTGEKDSHAKPRGFSRLEDDMETLPAEISASIETMIHKIAEREREGMRSS